MTSKRRERWMRIIVDEGSIHHLPSSSNKVCVWYSGDAKLKTKKIQLLPIFVLAQSPFAAVSKMKIQRHTIESSYIFRPIYPNFTQVKGCSRKHAQSCSCTCKLLHTYTHELGKGIKPCFFQFQKADLCLSLRISVREEW